MLKTNRNITKKIYAVYDKELCLYPFSSVRPVCPYYNKHEVGPFRKLRLCHVNISTKCTFIGLRSIRYLSRICVFKY